MNSVTTRIAACATFGLIIALIIFGIGGCIYIFIPSQMASIYSPGSIMTLGGIIGMIAFPCLALISVIVSLLWENLYRFFTREVTVRQMNTEVLIALIALITFLIIVNR